MYSANQVVLTQVKNVTDRWRNENIDKQAIQWTHQTVIEHGKILARRYLDHDCLWYGSLEVNPRKNVQKMSEFHTFTLMTLSQNHARHQSNGTSVHRHYELGRPAAAFLSVCVINHAGDKWSKRPVASLGLMSPGAATVGFTPIFPEKN